MVIIRRALLGLVLLAVATAPARAQETIAVELDVTAGYSGEEIRAAASQLSLSRIKTHSIDFSATYSFRVDR